MEPRGYTRILLLGLTSILTACLAACDSQAAPEFVGDALLTLRGSVEIEQAPERGELRPALAFFNGDTGKVYIVDAVVEGEFPSDFTLRVTKPPPDAAFFAGPDGIRSALGYITAVTADRPDSFRYATQSRASSTCWNTDEVPGGRVCDDERWWCSGQGEEQTCYGEWHRCVGVDHYDVGDDRCDLLDTVGDAALKDTWSKFAGLSENLVVVYLDEPLEADGKDAIRLGLPGLDPGYTVLEPQAEHDADSKDGAACDAGIEKRAFTLQEEKYGASLSYDELLEQGRCGWDSELDGQTWLACDPRTDMIWERVRELEPQAAAELGCRETGAWRVVDEQDSEHIDIRIGTRVEPSLFAPDRLSNTQPFAPAVSPGGPASGSTPFDPCAKPDIENVAWTEESPLGATPEALFGELEAGCTSTLTWENGERMITASGKTEVVVELRLDHDSARYSHFPSLYTERCHEQLAIDGELTVRTADGAVDQTSAVTLYPGGRVSALVPLEEHGGTLDVEREDGEVFLVMYNMSSAGEDCVGRISFVRQVVDPSRGVSLDATVRAGSGSWSNSGCDLGEHELDLSAPLESAGVSPQELVERLFGEITLDGAWKDDGTAAQLHLSTVSTPDANACGSERHVDLPVAVTYGTSDGAILEHTAEGLVDVSFRASGEMHATLSINDALECQDRSASLLYTPADCEALHGVIVALSLRSEDEKLVVQDGALFVYDFERGGVLDRFSDWETESADTRRTLELAP